MTKKQDRAGFLSSHGIDPNEVMLWTRKWYGHVATSKSRGIPSYLTFEDYVGLALKAGITVDQIGVTKYGLGRLGDVGPYDTGNCRFIPQKQNLEEMTTNGVYENISRKLKDRPMHTQESKDNIAEKNSKSFLLLSPEGDVVHGKNLYQFCSVTGLSYVCMSLVCRGQRKQHKGWTGEYIEN